MGAEIVCVARYMGQTGQGRTQLETDELLFRGPFRMRLPFSTIRGVAAAGGNLTLRLQDGAAELDLGPAAEKWAEKIRNPRTLIDKLGVKPRMLISLMELDDPAFYHLLRTRAERVELGGPAPGSDLIFLGLRDRADLVRFPELKQAIKVDGAIWTVRPKGRPKGRPEITEAETMAAGKAAGLVDVKVVRFSETHTAEKFVIPVARRRACSASASKASG